MNDIGKWTATQEQQRRHREAQELVAKELMGGCIESAVDTADFSTTESGNWHNWLREEVVKELRARDNEIKRLRGLLQEADTVLSLMPLPTRKFGDLRKRIREALGDE